MGPDYFGYTAKANDVTAVDWQAIETAIDQLVAPETQVFGDGSSYSPWESMVEGWSYDTSDSTCPPSSADTKQLVESLDATDPETMKALLRADLGRLRDWLENKPEGEFEDVYAVDGSLDRLGSGAILRTRADARHFVCAMDSEFQSLQRLGDARVIDGAHGLTLDPS